MGDVAAEVLYVLCRKMQDGIITPAEYAQALAHRMLNIDVMQDIDAYHDIEVLVRIEVGLERHPSILGPVESACEVALGEVLASAAGAGLRHGKVSRVRSDDAGESWTRVNSEARIWGRGSDFAEVKVDPRNKDILYSCNTSTYRSTDAGVTYHAFKGAPGGDDYHTLWIDPQFPANDGRFPLETVSHSSVLCPSQY